MMALPRHPALVVCAGLLQCSETGLISGMLLEPVLLDGGDKLDLADYVQCAPPPAPCASLLQPSAVARYASPSSICAPASGLTDAGGQALLQLGCSLTAPHPKQSAFKGSIRFATAHQMCHQSPHVGPYNLLLHPAMRPQPACPTHLLGSINLASNAGCIIPAATVLLFSCKRTPAARPPLPSLTCPPPAFTGSMSWASPCPSRSSCTCSRTWQRAARRCMAPTSFTWTSRFPTSFSAPGGPWQARLAALLPWRLWWWIWASPSAGTGSGAGRQAPLLWGAWAPWRLRCLPGQGPPVSGGSGVWEGGGRGVAGCRSRGRWSAQGCDCASG